MATMRAVVGVEGGGSHSNHCRHQASESGKRHTPSDHYSLLATIEDGFGLPRLANAKGAATLFDLLPDFSEKRTAQMSGQKG